MKNTSKSNNNQRAKTRQGIGELRGVLRDNTEAMHRLAEAVEFATIKMEVGLKDLSRRLDELENKTNDEDGPPYASDIARELDAVYPADTE